MPKALIKAQFTWHNDDAGYWLLAVSPPSSSAAWGVVYSLVVGSGVFPFASATADKVVGVGETESLDVLMVCLLFFMAAAVTAG